MSVDWHLLPGLSGVALCAAPCLVRPLRPHGRSRRAGDSPSCSQFAIAGCVAGAAIGRLTLAERERVRTALIERAEPRRAIELDPHDRALREAARDVGLR